jgi:hypothetical protein
MSHGIAGAGVLSRTWDIRDRSGNIAYAHVDADYRNRPEPGGDRRDMSVTTALASFASTWPTT